MKNDRGASDTINVGEPRPDKKGQSTAGHFEFVNGQEWQKFGKRLANYHAQLLQLAARCHGYQVHAGGQISPRI